MYFCLMNTDFFYNNDNVFNKKSTSYCLQAALQMS